MFTYYWFIIIINLVFYECCSLDRKDPHLLVRVTVESIHFGKKIVDHYTYTIAGEWVPDERDFAHNAFLFIATTITLL